MNELAQNTKRFMDYDSKPFYAAYLNTAKQNIYLTIRDISEKLGVSFNLNDDSNMLAAPLWSKLTSTDEPELSLQIISKLERHFPFCKYLALKQAFKARRELTAKPSDYETVFKYCINAIYEYRNYYTHAVHNKPLFPFEQIADLQLLFDAARRKVKIRFQLSPDDIKHLVRLQAVGSRGNQQIIERPDFKYGFIENNSISEKGFLFFTSLWLQRREAQEFLKKHRDFKSSRIPFEKATLETFTFYGIRLPRPRLTSDTSTEGLLLDMLNELKRCPKELYPLLSDEDKASFVAVDENEFEKDDANEHEGYEALPILKRSSNRFYELSLKYLESRFERLKFHIDLGDYCFHVYNQNIDGIERKRRWIKKMLAFGNLSDFAAEKQPAAWNNLVSGTEERLRNDCDIYITESTPHYHINHNNIGFAFIDSYNTLPNNKLWPELPALVNRENGKGPQRPTNKSPQGWLSLYELPSIAFYQILFQRGVAAISAEDVIANHQRSINKLFDDVVQGTIKTGITIDELKAELALRNLSLSFIPKTLVNLLTTKEQKSIEEKGADLLYKLLSESREMLKTVVKKDDGYKKIPGSKDYIEIKCGHMADFLARDLIRLQKPVNEMQGKANGTEFQVLQSKLALFGMYRETLNDTFRLCNLIDSPNAHPFLSEISIEQCTGILDFYTKYLKKRVIYFETCIKRRSWANYHFLKLNRGTNNAIELSKKLRNDAVTNIPRGLFLKPILEAIGASTETVALAEKIKRTPRVNVSYIIDRYFSLVMDDAPQEFYGYKRSYDFLNTLYDERTSTTARKSKQKRFLSPNQLAAISKEDIRMLIEKKVNAKPLNGRNLKQEQKEKLRESLHERFKHFANSEAQIRHAKVCDIVLFLMADETLRKEYVTDKLNPKKKNRAQTLSSEIRITEGYKLSAIKPNSDKDILSLIVPIALPVNGKIIRKDGMAIKKYGDFRALVKDRRVSSLFYLLEDDTIDFDALQQELVWFDKVRLEAFEYIFNFERKVIQAKGLKANNQGFIPFKDVLNSLVFPNNSLRPTINAIRNAFSHSEYPKPSELEGLLTNHSINQLKHYSIGNQQVRSSSIAYQLLDILKQSYHEIYCANNLYPIHSQL